MKKTGTRLSRALALLLTALLLCAPLTVLADTADDASDSSMSVSVKIYSLKMTDTSGSIEQSPNTPAFWECPILRAGEDLMAGTMIVRNDSEVSASMTLAPIGLPYDDEAKLSYLDHLLLTIYEGETVLYDNTYAHINDAEGGFTLSYPDMAPGEEHTYTIKLRCLYTYAGDPYDDTAVMSWAFSAQRDTTVVEDPSGLPLWMLITVAVIGAAVVVLIIVMIVRAVRKRHRSAQLLETEEREEMPPQE